MSWRDYSSLRVQPDRNRGLKKKYSVTGDILSYQVCRRQYGFFEVRGYQPAHLVQIWFGTIVHQVLDKLHMHYFGLINVSTKSQFPTDADVEIYFNQVEEGLRAKGIRAINAELRETALRVLKRFNRIEGPTLYPNVIDTECTLQSDRDNYILHGKVDVLRDISAGNAIPNYDLVEIWDYKGSRFPDIRRPEGNRKLERYTSQMLAYANLYRLKTGNFPLKGKLYFLNHLDGHEEPRMTPPQAVYEIDFRNPLYVRNIDKAMESFSSTVEEIQNCTSNDRWEAPEEIPDSETCDICDLRWDCPTTIGRYAMRYP